MAKLRLRLLPRKTKATALADWKHQYFDSTTGEWSSVFDGLSKTIYERMRKAKNLAAIEKIIENGGWTGYWCGACLNYVRDAAEVGHEDSSVIVCRSCAKKLNSLFGGA